VCSPETAASFSAVAYFFGRDINAREHVPIGLIDSTWGGTPGEAWVSLDGISSDASLMPVFAEWAHMANQQAAIPAMIKAEKREDAAAKAANQPVPTHPWHPDPASWAPSGLYNGMIAPGIGYGIKGVIWYQGETNSARSRAAMYAKVFPALIADWRTHWQQGNFPFLFVQISSFKSNETEDWPVVREAQRRTLSVANTAMAVTIDIGNPDNVHPADKQTVGARLALAARALAYGETVNYSGPLFRQTSTEPGGLRIWFDDVAGGLMANSGGLLEKSGELQGFEVAGDDGHFFPAAAAIQGATVLATSPQVQSPKYVRYGWRNAPTVNLFNSDGLPASPFTSEETIPAP
jgi:sialate O-acetylesterase